MRAFLRYGLFFFFLVGFSLTASSQEAQQRLDRSQVPQALQPWVSWSLFGYEQNVCPLFEGGSDTLCAWSSVLNLRLNDKSGQFEQKWTLDKESTVPLPGDTKHWPISVTVDGQGGTLLSKEDRPYAHLTKGSHTLSGNFFWDSLPESFAIPRETGILNLTVQGKPIDFPKVDAEGLIWLKEEELPAASGEQTLEVLVHRKMIDEIPFILVTHLKLRASGKTREVVLGKILPENFTPMAIASPLQTSIDPLGKLHVQVGAGEWEVEVRARHVGAVVKIELLEQPDPESLWPSEETWVFEAKNELRLVTLEGVTPLDPQQTLLPEVWKQLPAFRVRPGEVIQFQEKRRGDADLSPDNLHLARDLWLDFNGKGFTLQDRITGDLRQSSRLDVSSPIEPGRIAASGVDQLITKLKGREAAGVEVREGDVELLAESRIEKKRFSIPAIGWGRDFQGVIQKLHLPPGWRLLLASGADEVEGGWVNQWTLLEIFLLFVLVLAFAKLWDRRWGMIALFGLGLSLSEENAPQWIWVFVILGELLRRFLVTDGKWRWLTSVYRFVTLVLLLLIAIPFSIEQMRGALYPALEQTEVSYPLEEMTQNVLRTEGIALKGMAPPEGAGMAKEEDLDAQEIQQEVIQQKTIQKSYTQNIQNVPGAQIQTGPGIPKWQWSDVDLRWSGAVEKNQRLRLFLLPPFLNRFLSLVRVILLVFLLLRFFSWPLRFLPSLKPLFGLFGVLLLLSSSPVQANDFPPLELLDELRERLIALPECHPNCASISRMDLEVLGSHLRARLEISAGAETAVPLPGSATEWIPATVLLDGNQSSALHRTADGKLWIRIAQGSHQIILEGKLPNRSTVQIPLPLKPRYVTARGQGWSIGGLHEDGQAEDNLQMIRTGPATQGDAEELQAHNLPPFVLVERQMILGLNWEVETTVRRLTPLGQSIVLSVPLLEGESVTSEALRVENGKASVSMGPQTGGISWRSSFNLKEEIVLRASDALDWMEVWRLDAGPIWHVEASGIPPVRHFTEENIWLPEWQPWPAEELRLKIERPDGVQGQTVTIDRSLLEVNPGLRFTEATLSLNLRSSLGGQQSISLPAGAELKSVFINEVEQPIRQTQERVTVPVVPGQQAIKLIWQERGGIRFFFRTPKVDVGTPNVNATLQVHLPSDRWVLYLWGPKLGPKVLFWSLLFIFIVVCLGLSRASSVPLQRVQWFLFAPVLTQAPIWLFALVPLWFLSLAWRSQNSPSKAWRFNALQILLILLTLGALLVLFGTIYDGLLGNPNMAIQGNDSYDYFLKWFQDRRDNLLPRALIFSLPVSIYHLLLLAWALWLAWSFVGWMKWAWRCFSSGGLWQR